MQKKFFFFFIFQVNQEETKAGSTLEPHSDILTFDDLAGRGKAMTDAGDEEDGQDGFPRR